MSKNINRAKLDKAKTNAEYNKILKNQHLYCYICVRRSGDYGASCAPGAFNEKGWKYRENRNWKNHRKTQWK